MSDLVKRLRRMGMLSMTGPSGLMGELTAACKEAADRIEELEAELARLRTPLADENLTSLAAGESSIPNPKRVPVQIAVAIGKDGGWTAFGSSGDYKFSRSTAIDGLPEESYNAGYHVVRIHADVPLPPDDPVVVGIVDLPQDGA